MSAKYSNRVSDLFWLKGRINLNIYPVGIKLRLPGVKEKLAFLEKRIGEIEIMINQNKFRGEI